jgi:ABC-type siderophore export system fused ATPase/permease subunit
MKKGNISGLITAITQMVMFCLFGLIFYCCALFVLYYHEDFSHLMISMYTVVYIAKVLGDNTQFMPDLADANNSSARIFSLLDS